MKAAGFCMEKRAMLQRNRGRFLEMLSIKLARQFPYKTAQYVLLTFYSVMPNTDFYYCLLLFIVFCVHVEMFDVIIFEGICTTFLLRPLLCNVYN